MQNLIGKKAIDFTSCAVLHDGSFVEDFNLFKNIKDKYALLFFYPMDFTFVCPSELIALNNRLDEFKSRNVEVMAISIDSHFVHKAWKNTPVVSGGLGNIDYPLISDVKRDIITAYGLEDENTGVSYRGSFVIDNLGIIRVQHVHDFPIGRNIDEYVRLFDALIFHTTHGNVCQAGWVKGSDGMVPTSEGVSEFLSVNSKEL